MKLFWFLPTHGDSRYLGTSHGARSVSHRYLRQIAQAADELGYEGLLIPTGRSCEDSWVVASSQAHRARRDRPEIRQRAATRAPAAGDRRRAARHRDRRPPAGGEPDYRGSYTGLFKHLFDFVHHESLIDVPVLLAATGGSDRHALAIDHQLRPLFSFFQAHTLPIGVYATDKEFKNYRVDSDALRARIALAVERAVPVLRQRGQ